MKIKKWVVWISILLASCQPDYSDYLKKIETEAALLSKDEVSREEKMKVQLTTCIKEGKAALQSSEWEKVELCLRGGKESLNRRLPESLIDEYFRLTLLYYEKRGLNDSLLPLIREAKGWFHPPVVYFYQLYEARLLYKMQKYAGALACYHKLFGKCLSHFTVEDFYVLGRLFEKKYPHFDGEEWAHFIRGKGPYNVLWSQYLIASFIESNNNEKLLQYWCELFLYETETGSVVYSDGLFERIFPNAACNSEDKALLKEWFQKKGLFSSRWDRLKELFSGSELSHYIGIKEKIATGLPVEELLPPLVALETFYFSFPSYYYHCLQLFGRLEKLPHSDFLYPIMVKALQLSQNGCLNNDCQSLVRALASRYEAEAAKEGE